MSIDFDLVKLKPCPFCGYKVSAADEDTLYPTGTGWIIKYGRKHFCRIEDTIIPPTQWCYKIVCNIHYGGCGAKINGTTLTQTIDRWNLRKEY